MPTITSKESHQKIITAKYSMEELQELFRNDLESGGDAVDPGVYFNILTDAHNMIQGVEVTLVYQIGDTPTGPGGIV